MIALHARRLPLLAAVFLLATTTAACSDPWPETRPADFAVTQNRDGGMLPNYWQFDIKGLKGRYEARNRGVETKFDFTITRTEADALYAAFRRNRFDEIAIENRGRVYDRGGVAIAAAFGRTHFRKSNSGSDFVAKASVPAWRAVSAALARLRARVLRDHAKK